MRPVAIDLADPGAKAGRHYFDLETGQLIRIEAVLIVGGEGELPVTIDFADFRVVDGVTLAFQTELKNPAMHIVTRVESVQHNVELDDALFKPRKEE